MRKSQKGTNLQIRSFFVQLSRVSIKLEGKFGKYA